MVVERNYCSMKCRRMNPECVVCGTRVDRSHRYTCSAACRRVLMPPLRERVDRVTPKCSGCGVERRPGERWRSWCSPSCEMDTMGDRVMGLYVLALRHGAAGSLWRRNLLARLADRDGPDCGICGELVDLTLKSGSMGSEYGPSIDHVIPRSRGGSDDLSNLRLTHWVCNRKRGAGAPGDMSQSAMAG